VPRYKLSLCHTPIKPDLLGFPGIGVFACGLHDHVITRFASIYMCVCVCVCVIDSKIIKNQKTSKNKTVMIVSRCVRNLSKPK